MNSDWSFYDANGLLSGVHWSGPLSQLACNTPPGHTPIAGHHDSTRQRVDTQTGQLVPYQPPAPSDDEWQTWLWDATANAWTAHPTSAALSRDARAERDRRLSACDWTQLADVPSETSARWTDYRQALRDVTQQPGFPQSIDWPAEPGNGA